MKSWSHYLGCAAVAALVMGVASAQALELEPIFAPWNSRTTPGCSIGIQQGAQRTLAAFGATDLEHDIPNTPSSIFEAGSVSKQFTAAAVLLLVQDGKIRLTDDIRQYLPELPDFGARITIDHLLTHTSGLRDWGTLATLEGWPRTERAMTQADILDMMARQIDLNYAPGTEYSYTNTGYNLLAMIVERVSGRPFPEFSAERIFKPLGLTSTSWRADFRRIVKGRAVAYARNGQAYEQQMPFEDAIGAGGLLTTVEDLLTWNEALNSRKLGNMVVEVMERNGALNNGRQIRYAHGLRTMSRGGLREVSHDGATGAYRTWLARFPEQQLSIAVLCNAADVGRSALVLGTRIADQLLPPLPPPLPTSGGPMPQRAGQFVSASTGIPMVLVLENGALRKEGGERLRPIGADALQADDGVLRFDGNDRFTHEDIDGNRIVFNRKAPWSPSAAALSGMTGLYRSAELDLVYAVEAKNGQLVIRNLRRPNLTMPLHPAYSDAFLADTQSGARSGLAQFVHDAKGRVTELRMSLSNRVRNVRFVRNGNPAK
jgi:CubicO group peptidase (beta-lactamase class C family)